MGKLRKQHKAIPTSWACPVFPLDNFTVAFVGKKMENCDMKFVTTTFAPPYLRDKKVENGTFHHH